MVILPISKYSECQFQVLNIYPSLARASSSDLTRSSFLQPGPAHVLFYLRKPPQLSRYVSLSAPCVSRRSISVISHTEVISSYSLFRSPRLRARLQRNKAASCMQLHQALLQCTGQAGEKMLGQELDRDGGTMAPGSGPADSLT